MDLSIVTTLYSSAPYIEDFYARISRAAGTITDAYEIIFVNDGSPDNSLDIAKALFEKDHRVRIVDLSRNFGHHKAMMTGLAHASGDLVFLIDSDLEEEPELLATFYDAITTSGADVIYGVQQKRKGSFVEKIGGHLFYGLLNHLSNYPIPSNIITARLMRKRYVVRLIEHRDREVFIAGLWAITGFEQLPIIVNKTDKGTSVYDLKRKLSILVNSITSFSNRPLVYIFYLGILIMACSGCAALYLIIRRLFFDVLLSGWPSLIVSVWLLGGITIFCVGIIGIYLSKIFMETKDRPYTVVKEVYEKRNETHTY